MCGSAVNVNTGSVIVNGQYLNFNICNLIITTIFYLCSTNKQGFLYFHIKPLFKCSVYNVNTMWLSSSEFLQGLLSWSGVGCP